jgi:PKD repeat protein
LVAVNPQGVADLSKTPGATISIEVNITNAPPLNQFAAILTYNNTYLKAASPASLDYAGNILGSQLFFTRECLDGKHGADVGDGGCQGDDGPGVTSFAVSLLGNQTSTLSNGFLFKLTLQVAQTGFSPLHISNIVLATIKNGQSGVRVPAVTSDGYFTNIDCPRGSLTLCKPPIADFTISPQVLTQGVAATFNGTTSTTPNPGAKIVRYDWFWGDPVGRGEDLNVAGVSKHAYSHSGNYTVTLAVTDTYSASAYRSFVVQVINVVVQALVNDITVNPLYGVLPGAVVNITAQIQNAGTVPINGTFRILLEGNSLGAGSTKQFQNLQRLTHSSLSFAWDTKPYTPRVYRIDVVISPIANESNPNLNRASAYIQLIVSFGSGNLSLNLLQTTGLGILVVAAIGAALVRFRKKPSYLTEPLEG